MDYFREGVPPPFFARILSPNDLFLFRVQEYDSARLKFGRALRGEVTIAGPLPLFSASVDSK
jgi:hypothetical protein